MVVAGVVLYRALTVGRERRDEGEAALPEIGRVPRRPTIVPGGER